MPIDTETYLKVTAALDRCRRTGWDPAEELDRLGLVLTPARKLGLQTHILGLLLNQLSIYRPVELLRRKFHAGHPCSPADMYVVVLEFIEEYRDVLREQG